jgi:uncharacterized protein (TIGR00725 family)
MSARKPQIAVVGAGQAGDELLASAEEVGRLIAESGAALVCGGLSGVMDAAAKGAARAGGDVIGVLPGNDPRDANEHVTHVVATGVGHARNLAVVGSGDAVIAVGGAWGTLTEIAFARKLGRPVVALGSWPLRARDDAELGIIEAETPADAVRAAIASLEG